MLIKLSANLAQVRENFRPYMYELIQVLQIILMFISSGKVILYIIHLSVSYRLCCIPGFYLPTCLGYR
jgi:hypothetical protein